jgi:hypothetical protein
VTGLADPERAASTSDTAGVGGAFWRAAGVRKGALWPLVEAGVPAALPGAAVVVDARAPGAAVVFREVLGKSPDWEGLVGDREGRAVGFADGAGDATGDGLPSGRPVLGTRAAELAARCPGA